MPIFPPPAGAGGGASSVTIVSGGLAATVFSGALESIPAATPSGQALSGSTVRTVQYTFATGSVSGSSLVNQLIAPQGAGNRIRVLALSMMTANACNVQFQSTGSAGTVTNVSSIYYLPASGVVSLPESNHGWFQTNANEGLNVSMTAAGQVGVTLTWIIAGP